MLPGHSTHTFDNNILIEDSQKEKNSEHCITDNIENNVDDIFSMPTQKLNLKLTESFDDPIVDGFQENPSTQSELLDSINKLLQTCLKSNSMATIKRKLEIIWTYIKKLQSITKLNINAQSVQTVTDNNIHHDRSTQTYFELIERGVQTILTENSYSENTNFQASLTNTITQGTKKALQSFLCEPDFSISKTLKEIQNKMFTEHSNDSSQTKQKTQNDVLRGTLDNMKFETQDLARIFLEKSTSEKLEKHLKHSSVNTKNESNQTPQTSKVTFTKCLFNFFTYVSYINMGLVQGELSA